MLAPRCTAWQGSAMNDTPPRNPAAGGFLIAMGAIIGAFGGVFFGESTRGLIGGVAIGAVLATIVWWRDRR
jgi:uncharacterized membrane protein